MKDDKDLLKELFFQLPREKYSDQLRSKIMYHVMLEAERMHKRNERLNRLICVFSLVLMVVFAFGVFYYINESFDFTIPDISFPDLSLFPFYIYIGFLALILLGIDHKFREIYKKKHKKERQV